MRATATDVFLRNNSDERFQSVRIELLDEVLPKFLAWQERLKASVDEANGLPLEAIKVVSPFDRRVKCILLAQERQYLWKVEKVKEAISYRAVNS